MVEVADDVTSAETEVASGLLEGESTPPLRGQMVWEGAGEPVKRLETCWEQRAMETSTDASLPLESPVWVDAWVAPPPAPPLLAEAAEDHL